MVNWRIVYTKQAQADISKLKAAHLERKGRALVAILRENPFQTPPIYEKLRGDLKGYYSRRLNIKHRIVYQVLEDENVVKIVSMWTHYEL